MVTGEQLSCGRPRDAFARTSGYYKLSPGAELGIKLYLLQ